MKHPIIVAALAVVLVSSCTPYVDPCSSRPDSSACRLESAKAQSTFDMRLTLQAIDIRDRADESTRQASESTRVAAAVATEEAYNAQVRVLQLTQTAQALVDADATRTQTIRDADRIAAARTVRETATAIASATRTSAQTSAVQTRQAADLATYTARAQRQATDETINVIVRYFLLALGLILIAIVAYRLVRALPAIGRGLRGLCAIVGHYLTVRVSTVRSTRTPHRTRRADTDDPNSEPIDAPYLVLPRGDGQGYDLIDLDQIVGGHMLSDGRGQPLSDDTLTPDQRMWLYRWLFDHASRDQMVKLHQRTMGGIELLEDGHADSDRDQPALELSTPTGSVLAAPPFSQLITTWRPAIDRMLLAYGASGPIYGGIDSLLSTGIIGRQNVGKTTLLRFVYVQCLMIGVQVIVWDLHDDVVSDLPGALAHTKVSEIAESAGRVVAELDRRIDANDRASAPTLVLADEFNQLARACPETIDVVGRIAMEGRKYKMFCMLSAKGLPSSLFGGATVRDAFSSRFAFHTTPAMARMAGFEKEIAATVDRLTPGQALFDGPVDPQIIAVPNTTPDDVRRVLALQPHFSASNSPSTPSGSGNGRGHGSGLEGEVEAGMEGGTEVDNDKRARVRALLADKTPTSKVIEQVWGVTGGSGYRNAASELSEIVASLVRA